MRFALAGRAALCVRADPEGCLPWQGARALGRGRVCLLLLPEALLLPLRLCVVGVCACPRCFLVVTVMIRDKPSYKR